MWHMTVWPRGFPLLFDHRQTPVRSRNSVDESYRLPRPAWRSMCSQSATHQVYISLPRLLVAQLHFCNAEFGPLAYQIFSIESLISRSLPLQVATWLNIQKRRKFTQSFMADYSIHHDSAGNYMAPWSSSWKIKCWTWNVETDESYVWGDKFGG